MMSDVYEVTDQNWRGIGMIPLSGLKLSSKYSRFDAESIFDLENINPKESELCIAGEILQGLKKPNQCPAFGQECSPEKPLCAPMVSQEGACSAYYRYKIN